MVSHKMVISRRNIVLLTIGLVFYSKGLKQATLTNNHCHALSVTGSEIPYTILYLL